MREIDAPARFESRGRAPPQVLIVGRVGEVGLGAEGTRGQRAEHLPRDRLALRDAVHRIGEHAVARIREPDRRVADRRRNDGIGVERHRVEGGSLRAIERARERVRARRVRRHRQPPRLAVRVVREPGREDDVALMREVDAPARFGLRGEIPPQPGVIRGRCARRRVGVDHRDAVTNFLRYVHACNAADDNLIGRVGGRLAIGDSGRQEHDRVVAESGRRRFARDRNGTRGTGHRDACTAEVRTGERQRPAVRAQRQVLIRNESGRRPRDAIGRRRARRRRPEHVERVRGQRRGVSTGNVAGCHRGARRKENPAPMTGNVIVRAGIVDVQVDRTDTPLAERDVGAAGTGRACGAVAGPVARRHVRQRGIRGHHQRGGLDLARFVRAEQRHGR